MPKQIFILRQSAYIFFSSLLTIILKAFESTKIKRVLKTHSETFYLCDFNKQVNKKVLSCYRTSLGQRWEHSMYVMTELLVGTSWGFALGQRRVSLLYKTASENMFVQSLLGFFLK